MKLFVFIFYLILFLSFISAEESFTQSNVSNSTICRDSDGGKNYFVEGIADNRINGVGSWYKDICLEFIWTNVNGSQNGIYTPVDSCSGSDCHLFEGYCEGGSVTNRVYECSNGCSKNACIGKISESDIVTEGVKCVFDGSKSEQKCYLADSMGKSFSCSGIDACVVYVSGVKGSSFTWKSSCGGYAYTTIDGENDYAKFSCASVAEVKSGDILGKGFKHAYYECYDDKEFFSEDDKCVSSEAWQKYAKEFCNEHCYSDGSKCGVKLFSISGECYPDDSSTSITHPNLVSEQAINDSELVASELFICKDSCALDSKCYPFGYRKGETYCSDTGAFQKQLTGDTVCENSFECNSNVCVSGKCVSSGFIERLFSWFKSIFGSSE